MKAENYYTITGQRSWGCPICRGVLHSWHECATKKRLDAFAKANNDVANWGQWKYESYYREVLDTAKLNAESKRENQFE